MYIGEGELTVKISAYTIGRTFYNHGSSDYRLACLVNDSVL